MFTADGDGNQYRFLKGTQHCRTKVLKTLARQLMTYRLKCTDNVYNLLRQAEKKRKETKELDERLDFYKANIANVSNYRI